MHPDVLRPGTASLIALRLVEFLLNTPYPPGAFFADAKNRGCPFQARLFALVASDWPAAPFQATHLLTLNKGSLTLYGRNAPMREQPRPQRVRHPLTARLIPTAAQGASAMLPTPDTRSPQAINAPPRPRNGPPRPARHKPDIPLTPCGKIALAQGFATRMSCSPHQLEQW